MKVENINCVKKITSRSLHILLQQPGLGGLDSVEDGAGGNPSRVRSAGVIVKLSRERYCRVRLLVV